MGEIIQFPKKIKSMFPSIEEIMDAFQRLAEANAESLGLSSEGSSFCTKCGRCCRGLNWSDRLDIAWATKSLMLSSQCKFLTDENLCKIYSRRPKVCKEWKCGVFPGG